MFFRSFVLFHKVEGDGHMHPISYSLSYSPNTPTKGDNGFYVLDKPIMQRMAYPSKGLPCNLAGVNLEGKKYTNNEPPPLSKMYKKVSWVVQSLGLYVRGRFSRDFKPIDHLGGANPEERLPLYEFRTINDMNRDLEIWPKVGSTFENMDILVI